MQLEQPYLYSPMYLKEASQSPFFQMPEIIQLNVFNQQIVEFYQMMNGVEKYGAFELAFKYCFGTLSQLRFKYVLLALGELEKMVQKHQINEQAKEVYKQRLKNTNH